MLTTSSKKQNIISSLKIDDTHSYILCQHTISKLDDIHVIAFKNIISAYNYIENNNQFVNLNELVEGHQKYLSNQHLRIGRNMLFSKDYVYSFDYNNMRYELYGIDSMSKFVLLIFFGNLSQIVSVKSYDIYEDAVNQLQVEYEKRYGIGKKYDGDYKFGQIFKCVYHP